MMLRKLILLFVAVVAIVGGAALAAATGQYLGTIALGAAMLALGAALSAHRLRAAPSAEFTALRTDVEALRAEIGEAREFVDDLAAIIEEMTIRRARDPAAEDLSDMTVELTEVKEMLGEFSRRARGGLPSSDLAAASTAIAPGNVRRIDSEGGDEAGGADDAGISGEIDSDDAAGIIDREFAGEGEAAVAPDHSVRAVNVDAAFAAVGREVAAAAAVEEVAAAAAVEEVACAADDAGRRDRLAARFELILQPVFALPDGPPRFLEACSRLLGADGSSPGGARHIEAVARNGEIAEIDALLLRRSFEVAKKLADEARDVGVFVNISARSLRDGPAFAAMTKALSTRGELAPQMVLEFNQGDLCPLSDDAAARLRRIAGMGYRFSLDHVSDWSIDVERMSDIGFRYVKLSAEAFLTRARNRRGDDASPGTPHRALTNAPAGAPVGALTDALTDAFARFGLEFIIERIEDPETLRAVAAAGARLGQGLALGEPRRIRRD